MNKKLILEHALVPKHEVLEKKEINKLLKRLGVTIENLPKILETDPVVKAIKAKKGDVLKITRTSPTLGESVYYRVVV